MSTDAKSKRLGPAELEAERARREEMAAMNAALARKICTNCSTPGAWKVYDLEPTAGRVRYVKCLACGHCDQVPVIVHQAAVAPAAGGEGVKP